MVNYIRKAEVHGFKDVLVRETERTRRDTEELREQVRKLLANGYRKYLNRFILFLDGNGTAAGSGVDRQKLQGAGSILLISYAICSCSCTLLSES